LDLGRQFADIASNPTRGVFVPEGNTIWMRHKPSERGNPRFQLTTRGSRRHAIDTSQDRQHAEDFMRVTTRHQTQKRIEIF
jgi:hypothetical protein